MSDSASHEIEREVEKVRGMRGDNARGARHAGRAIRERLSYANVMATAAVFIALGGSAWAVAANSVGSKELKRNAVEKRHIKRNAVAAAELRRNAVRTRQIRDGAVTDAKLAEGVAVSGPQGEPGPQGPPGPATGPAGGDLTGNYPNPLIANGAVTGAKLADGAVRAQVDSLFEAQRFIETGNGVGNQFGCTPGLLAVRIADGLEVAVNDRFTFQVPGPSAEAWGQIRSNGSIRSSSGNVTSVDHPETGVYCIQLSGGGLDLEGAVVSMHLN